MVRLYHQSPLYQRTPESHSLFQTIFFVLADFMPSMRELGGSQGSSELLGLSSQQQPVSNDVLSSAPGGNSSQQHDLSDISFLDPVNPDLVAMTNHLEQLRLGGGGASAAVLPGTLCQPMSVEEKVGNSYRQTWCPNESDVGNIDLEKQQIQVFLCFFIYGYFYYSVNLVTKENHDNAKLKYLQFCVFKM